MESLEIVANLRSEADSVAQDWNKLARYLSTQGMNLILTRLPQQFAGGFANLNYLVVIDGTEAVLRRPPMGELPVGAYDMGRESRILSRLWQRFPLAPRSFHLCEDVTVLGAQFQITEYRRGVSFRDQLPTPLANDAQACAQIGQMLITVLANLHTVEPSDEGLENLGKPDGFIDRAIDGWCKRAHSSMNSWATPATKKLLVELNRWLRTKYVAGGRVSILHNDFKLDNLLLNPETLDPVAVLDWDQCTRGNPLFDLATLLSYWTEPNDPPAMHLMAQMPTTRPGFPSRREAAEAYAKITGVDLSELRFHRVLATFKTAVIFAQLYTRFHEGMTQDERYAHFGELASGLLDFAHELSLGNYY